MQPLLQILDKEYDWSEHRGNPRGGECQSVQQMLQMEVKDQSSTVEVRRECSPSEHEHSRGTLPKHIPHECPQVGASGETSWHEWSPASEAQQKKIFCGSSKVDTTGFGLASGQNKTSKNISEHSTSKLQQRNKFTRGQSNTMNPTRAPISAPCMSP